MNTIEAIIFDLDDTLFDTSEYLVEDAIKDSISTMIALGLNCELETALNTFYELMKENNSVDFFANILQSYGVRNNENTDLIYIAGKDRFYNREIPDTLQLDEETKQTLVELKTKYRLHLVTSGVTRTQMQKIKILQLDVFFPSFCVVEIARGESKKDEIISFSQKNNIDFHKILIVGDRIDNEIKHGNDLGCITCRVKKGFHLYKHPTNTSEIPNYEIAHIQELLNF